MMQGWSGHRLALTLFLTVLVAWLAIMAVLMHRASLPADATGPMLAVFEPGTSADDIFAKLTFAGATPVRQTAFGFIWVVTSEQPGLAGKLVQHGAIGAYRELPISPSLAGCFALADAKVTEYMGL